MLSHKEHKFRRKATESNRSCLDKRNNKEAFRKNDFRLFLVLLLFGSNKVRKKGKRQIKEGGKGKNRRKKERAKKREREIEREREKKKRETETETEKMRERDNRGKERNGQKQRGGDTEKKMSFLWGTMFFLVWGWCSKTKK